MFEFINHYDELGEWLFTGVVFFLGLTLGWFCKFNTFWAVVGVIIFLPIINVLLQADHYFLNIPFILGFLVHTHKKIASMIGWRR
jgi:hypothetical protein